MTYDFTDALAKLDKQLKHNRECPNEQCLDRDECYGTDAYNGFGGGDEY